MTEITQRRIIPSGRHLCSGRNAFDGLLGGTARIIEHEGHLFNRMLRDDICRIVIASLSKPLDNAH